MRNVVLLLALGVWGCGDTHEGSSQAVQLSSLAGSEQLFQVNRVWDGSSGGMPQYPYEELLETDYNFVSDGSTYRVAFSQDGSGVEIGDTPIVGGVPESDEGRRRYELQEGAFAGGRFVVWVGDEDLHAELTLYGSGLPIVQSERGILAP